MLKHNSHDHNIYFAIILQYPADQLVFINKLGVDLKISIQKTGWAPYGVALVLYTPYNWGKTRLNMLPAYIVNSVLVALIYKGLINGEGFEFWVVNTLLPQCNRFSIK